MFIGHLDIVSGDNISKEFDAVLCPHALLMRNAEAIVSQAGKDFAKDLIFVESGVVHRDVVHKAIVHWSNIPKDMVDHSLECGGRVGQTEGHNGVFEQAIAAAKCHFPFVPFLELVVLWVIFRED